MVCVPPVVRLHRKSRSVWRRRRRQRQRWPVRCQPDMLNQNGSLVKGTRERAPTRCTRVRAITDGDQSPSNRARTMRVVPPESARSRELLLPPTLSRDFCLPLTATVSFSGNPEHRISPIAARRDFLLFRVALGNSMFPSYGSSGRRFY